MEFRKHIYICNMHDDATFIQAVLCRMINILFDSIRSCRHISYAQQRTHLMWSKCNPCLNLLLARQQSHRFDSIDPTSW